MAAPWLRSVPVQIDGVTGVRTAYRGQVQAYVGQCYGRHRLGPWRYNATTLYCALQGFSFDNATSWGDDYRIFYKSTDNGATWAPIGSETTGSALNPNTFPPTTEFAAACQRVGNTVYLLTEVPIQHQSDPAKLQLHALNMATGAVTRVYVDPTPEPPIIPAPPGGSLTTYEANEGPHSTEENLDLCVLSNGTIRCFYQFYRTPDGTRGVKTCTYTPGAGWGAKAFISILPTPEFPPAHSPYPYYEAWLEGAWVDANDVCHVVWGQTYALDFSTSRHRHYYRQVLADGTLTAPELFYEHDVTAGQPHYAVKYGGPLVKVGNELWFPVASSIQQQAACWRIFKRDLTSGAWTTEDVTLDTPQGAVWFTALLGGDGRFWIFWHADDYFTLKAQARNAAGSWDTYDAIQLDPAIYPNGFAPSLSVEAFLDQSFGIVFDLDDIPLGQWTGDHGEDTSGWTDQLAFYATLAPPSGVPIPSPGPQPAGGTCPPPMAIMKVAVTLRRSTHLPVKGTD